MIGHSNFIPSFGTIEDVLRLIAMGQTVICIQVFDPILIQAYLSCIESSKVALSKDSES